MHPSPFARKIPALMRILVIALTIVCGGAAFSAATAQPTPGGPLKIVVIEGEGAINVIQQKTAVMPLIEVRDRNDQPVAGAVVNFVVRNGRATFGGARTLTVTTNSVGRAAAAGLTPGGSGALEIGATATFQGQTAAVTIAQTNVLTAAEAAGASAGAGGGSSGGATAGAGGGAGSGGGVSGTTLGIVGGAAVAGAAAVVMKPEEAAAEAPVRAVPPVYTADPSFTTELLFVTVPQNGPGCTNIHQFQVTLTVRLDSVDGPPNGTFDVSGVVNASAGTCPSNSDNNFRANVQASGRVSGSREDLVASASVTNAFTTSSAVGQTTQEFIFNGRIVDDQLSGVLTYNHTNRFRNTVFNNDGLGTGQTKLNVAFRKTP